jgi:hypothetical protein
MSAGSRHRRNQQSLNQRNQFNLCKPHLRHLLFRSRNSLPVSSAMNTDRAKDLRKRPLNRLRPLRKVRHRFPEARRNAPNSPDVQRHHPTARTVRLLSRHAEKTGQPQHLHRLLHRRLYLQKQRLLRG